MRGALEKVRQGGSTELAVTERGTFFGYGDLVVDFRSVGRLRAATAAAVVFDATHSVQQPGQGTDGTSGGLREYIPALLLAASAAGVDGFFLETHPDPANAPSDAETQWPLDKLEPLLARALSVWRAAQVPA
jgi:2-dehydro-3-deoxyphosphooctonate aldolase (KDO 8-P synthase)